jgi:hypothetical protein|tara:strand:- start:1033 stop:1224 length:192 start_codon:yes stop_codon:yes gene_type:complete
MPKAKRDIGGAGKKPPVEGYKGGSLIRKKLAGGGIISGIKPTNQSTVKAKGAGAATKGFNFKV